MASYKKDVPFIPDEMKSPEPSEVARRLGQVIYGGLLYTSAENIALCLEDYAQSQNAALRAEVEALRARVAWKRVVDESPPMMPCDLPRMPRPDEWFLFWYDGQVRRVYAVDHHSVVRCWAEDGIINVSLSPDDFWQPLPQPPSE